MEELMPKGYQQLTYEERCQIDILKKSGKSDAEIGELLGRDRTTIWRELQRNSGKRSYRCKQAQDKAESRRTAASSEPKKMTPDVISHIEEKLTTEQWSPEQISGRMGLDGVTKVCHEQIYQHIWGDKKKGGSLYKNLRHAGKKRNKRKGKNSGRGLIPGRVDIDQRPAVVEKKSRLGDWEGDTIVGKNHRGAILSHVDRKSKYTKLSLLPDKTANSVVTAIQDDFAGILTAKTITYDNGKEFAGHAKISETTGAKCYFAKPYHSWERGLNEHTNGLVRQYFPKKTNFATITAAEVKEVERKLNDRPRKSLGYKTPREVFNKNATRKPVALRC